MASPSGSSSDPHQLRRGSMVKQLERKGIRDRRVLEAMRRVPRHLFVDEDHQGDAYSTHRSLPIGDTAQTLSQPWTVARTTELLQLEPHHKVLEIGTGSGYHTAVLALLARWVYSLERIVALSRAARARVRQLGVGNVKIQTFDGTVGWADVAPFDRILVTAGAPQAPQPLLDQLAESGRFVLPEGDRRRQRLVVYQRRGGSLHREVLDEAAFVPLIGRHGWADS
ncbi:MAG: protein-L-isoaspartate(D-aspartate) O-methyltransferase [Acidobacteriota bacterium]